MECKVEMDKLTEKQLEAFRIINNAAVELELERRVRESTYEDEAEFMEDVSKAYFFLRPMYDNMRNNDTKKTITNSGIIETLEKSIRTAKANKIKYKEYESTVVTESAPEKEPEQTPAQEKEPEQAPAPEKEPAEATKPAVWIISDIKKPEPIPTPEPFSGPYKPVVQPIPQPKEVNDPYNPTPMPLRPLLQQESQPAPQPAPQPIPQPAPQPAPQPVAQSVPQSRLNEILANIPVVGN